MKAGLLEHMNVFVAIARSGSFTAAADALGTGQATVSRQLAALEKHLGCRLVQRSTRFVSLTEKGRALLAQAEHLVQATHAAHAALQDAAPALSGRLRVACSNAFGRRVILPQLPAWRAAHPQVALELLMSDAIEPIVKKGIDVAIRLSQLPSSTLVATRLGSSHSFAYASVAYLKRRGRPEHPDELAHHECIAYSGASAHWRFIDAEGRAHAVNPHGTLMLSSVDALQDAVLAGLGVAVMPSWFWREERLQRQAVRLFDGLHMAVRPLVAVASARAGPASRAAAFVRFIREAWRSFEAPH